MNDCLPEASPYWQQLETLIRQLVAGYGYSEIRMPVVEKTPLFARSIGQVTDIVEKEMYTFTDRNEESLSLRPEGTASCVRAGIEHGLLYNQEQRLWYMGPMFRHERPQKGRYRQFHQMGAETFGLAGPDVDAELILMTARLWRQLEIGDEVELQLNSLGSPETRVAYRQALVDYFMPHADQLDEDSRRRLDTNPLRILDSKNPDLDALIEGAPRLADYLDDESREHFDGLCTLLDAAGIHYRVNPRLVRGLDYYNRTVFEWVTESLGAQGTICAGGRYDGLVEQLGGKATPACGFAMGLERIVALLEARSDQEFAAADVYVIGVGDTGAAALNLAEQLRDRCPGIRVRLNCGGGNFKKQFKRADKSGARVAVILAASELERDEVSIKYLREARDQVTVPGRTIYDLINQYFLESGN